MSGIAPLFASAPRMVIKVNGTDIGYAIGLNMNVSIDVQPIKAIGYFGPVSLEPTMYNPVSGTFRLIRLLNKNFVNTQVTAAKSARSGNSLIGKAAPEYPETQAALYSKDGETGNITGTNTTAATNRFALHRHLDPETVLISKTFDIEIYLHLPTEDTIKVANDKGVRAEVKGTLVPRPFLYIRDCRVISADGELSPGRLFEEPLSFQGLVAVNARFDSGYQEQVDSAITDGVV